MIYTYNTSIECLYLSLSEHVSKSLKIFKFTEILILFDCYHLDFLAKDILPNI